jgi:hypothetical protein
MTEQPSGPHPHQFHIQIDREHYTVTEPKLTGAEIRKVPPTPIPADRDLYLVRPGQDDLLIADDELVEMRDGLRFFTAPSHINPGSPSPTS